MPKRIDLTGKRFGRLVVESFSHTDKHRHIMWNCLCDCGNTTVTCTSSLLHGNTNSCGCIQDARSDIVSVGQRFGRLTVQARAGKNKRRQRLWVCACDCGNIVHVETRGLMSGSTQSCGCLRRDKIRERSVEFNTKHGLSRTNLYHVWVGMIQRIEDINCPAYKNYGGRGISICSEWRSSFKAFYDWAISNGYREGLSIDRIDVNGNYCPENCRWATRKQQANNMRKTIRLEYDGRSLTISEASELYNIPRSLLAGRIRRGWSVQDAIELPPRTHRKKRK